MVPALIVVTNPPVSVLVCHFFVKLNGMRCGNTNSTKPRTEIVKGMFVQLTKRLVFCSFGGMVTSLVASLDRLVCLLKQRQFLVASRIKGSLIFESAIHIAGE